MTWLTVPGLGSSEAARWQTLWEQTRTNCRRVELGFWDDPDRERWISALGAAIQRAGSAPVLVARSLGCLAVAWWVSCAGREAGKVAGALLVAPPDVERADADPHVRRFAPAPQMILPLPTLLVVSRNDPCASIVASAALAARWSVSLHDAGAIGHLHAASGRGSWKEGQRLIESLLIQAR